MIFQLPLVSDLPHYSFSTELDGVTYLFTLRWNSRAFSWFISISTSDEIPIVSNQRLVSNYRIFARHVQSELPAGTFFTLDTTGGKQYPTRDNLGTDFQLFYADASEQL